MDSFNTGFNQDNYINTLALHQELLEVCIFKLNQRNKSQNINYELNYNTIIIYIIKEADEFIEIPSFNKFIGGLEFKKIKPTELKFVIELIENFKIHIEIKYVNRINNNINNQYLIDNLIKENDNLKKELNFKIEENKELKLKIKQLEILKTNYQTNPQHPQTSNINIPKLDMHQDTTPNSPTNYNGILRYGSNYNELSQNSYKTSSNTTSDTTFKKENTNTNTNTDIEIIKPIRENCINNQQNLQNLNTNNLNKNSLIDLKNIKSRINITYNNIRYNEKIPISYVYNNIRYSSEPTFEDLIKYKTIQLYNKEIGGTLILKKPEFILEDYLRNEKNVFIKTYIYPRKYLNSTIKLPNEDIVFRIEDKKYIEIKLNQNLHYKLYIFITLA